MAMTGVNWIKSRFGVLRIVEMETAVQISGIFRAFLNFFLGALFSVHLLKLVVSELPVAFVTRRLWNAYPTYFELFE